MSDRELLELAAKAAGLEVWRGAKHQSAKLFARCANPDGVVKAREWNPLSDDGDALRLAVRLGIVPRSINGVCFAWADGVCDIQEPHNADPYAATRRAIVRAAAEIGRAMP